MSTPNKKQSPQAGKRDPDETTTETMKEDQDKQLGELEGRTTTTKTSYGKTKASLDLDAVAVVCGNCDAPKTESHKLIRCPCHSVQYCNKHCQKKHRKKHKKLCHKLMAEKKLKKEKQTTTTTPPKQQQEEEGERKEDNASSEPAIEKEEEGDECPICLEILSINGLKFGRWTCCGNGIHTHCYEDMKSMKMSGTCPFCRAKIPTSEEEAVKQLRPWVKKKKAWAMSLMGQRYEQGKGVKQSYEMAKRLWEQAAQQGNITAMCNLVNMYYSGQGVEQSYEKAFEYSEQAADLGSADAQYNLGIMYERGRGVEQSYKRAVEYYEQAAHLGKVNAQYNLGNMYYKGQGAERNLKKAREWWTKAAAQGDEAATDILKRTRGM